MYFNLRNTYSSGQNERDAMKDKELINESVKTAMNYQGKSASFLTDQQLRRLVASVVMSESSGGKLNPNNPNMLGRYQFATIRLVDLGYLNLDKWNKDIVAKGLAGNISATNAFRDDPKNWNNGLSAEKFLKSAKVQDEAFSKSLEKSYKFGLRNNLYNKNTSPTMIMATLKAQHLVGDQKYSKKGDNAEDGNRTAKKYKDDILLNKDGLDESMQQAEKSLTSQKKSLDSFLK